MLDQRNILEIQRTGIVGTLPRTLVKIEHNQKSCGRTKVADRSDDETLAIESTPPPVPHTSIPPCCRRSTSIGADTAPMSLDESCSFPSRSKLLSVNDDPDSWYPPPGSKQRQRRVFF